MLAKPRFTIWLPVFFGAAVWALASAPVPAAAQPDQALTPVSLNQLSFQGGIDGVGVTTGAPKVYVVFWGTQWGVASTNSSGDLTFTGDSSGMAPDYQAFLRGLGTGGETWSGVMTQYCEAVATGSQSCPSTNSSHVGYPTGGALAGTWYDNSGAAPSQATAHALAQEAVSAANHFGNTTQASNRSAQYVVVSPHGTNPDNYQGGAYCAWHSYTGNSTLDGGGQVSTTYGPIAFTNLPYLPDAGGGCGANFVNAGTAGALDGVTIVGSQEYAATITDQFSGGWANSGGGDDATNCAWISTGQGATQNVTFSTGTFPVTSTWANDFNGGTGGCEVSHPIVTNPGDFSIAAVPSSQTVAAGSSTSYTVSTSVTSGSAQSVSLSAGGLPSGVSATYNPASVTAGGSTTLTITAGAGVPAGTYTLTITGTGPFATHSTTTSLVVTAVTIPNGGFESGSLSGWTVTGAAGISSTSHSGTFAALVGSARRSKGDSSISQTFTVPTGATTLSFWYEGVCPDSVSLSWATATLHDAGTGSTVTLLPKTCTNGAGYVEVVYDVSALVGHSLTLKLTSHDDNDRADGNYTLFDDVAVS
ncbi:MAG TPA: hypothetical protein VF137_07405 [Candidatus Dormibacteraeota bacterium]